MKRGLVAVSGDLINRLSLPVAELVNTYKQGRNATQLALQYNCSKGTIIKILRKRGIKIRPYPKRIELSETKLSQLYLLKHMSTWEIEKKFGYSRGTIYTHIKKLGINRDIATSHFVYNRRQFSNDLRLKAYMLGFAIGDLRVRKVGKLSKTIKVDCRSTKNGQVDLFKSLFSNYGRVWIGKPDSLGKVQMEAFLDDSFSFLIDAKNKYKWVLTRKKFFISFMAGFIDAEGSFFISKRPHFSLGNYNLDLLEIFQKSLFKSGFRYVYIYHDKRKGMVSSEGYVFNENYHMLVINRKAELLRFIDLIVKDIRHPDRLKQIYEVRRYFNGDYAV